MRFRLFLSRVPVALAAGDILLAACGGGRQIPLPVCEQSTALLTARTADGAATIAAVDITGNCQVVPSCAPSTATPCATVLIQGFLTNGCSLTFVSLDGRSVSATVSVVPTGPTYQCRDDLGAIHAAGFARFEPHEIVIDFSTATPADAGTD